MDPELKAIQREIRQQRREARALWLSTRKAFGYTRFTDAAALRALELAVERCYGSVQWRDVETAIRKHGADQYAKSPWYLDSWAEQAKFERERGTTPAVVEDQLAALRAARR